MQEEKFCPLWANGNSQESLLFVVEQPYNWGWFLRSYQRDIITNNVTCDILCCCVVVGDKLPFQPGVNQAVELKMFSRYSDPVDEPTIVLKAVVT